MLPADLSTLPSIFEPQIAEAEEPGFDNLGLSRKLVRALSIQGIHTPFPIQVATIPDALAGRDVLGRGRTGSGKTLAFGLPMLTRLAASGRATPHHPKALVLVPTRELAMQVNDALTPLAKVLGLFCKTAVGGVPYDRQIWSLERGVDVLVATPGRLGDLIKRGVANLSAVEITVLDEADQMADMGFLPEVTELLDMTPKGSQRLLFSATLDMTSTRLSSGSSPTRSSTRSSRPWHPSMRWITMCCWCRRTTNTTSPPRSPTGPGAPSSS